MAKLNDDERKVFLTMNVEVAASLLGDAALEIEGPRAESIVQTAVMFELIRRNAEGLVDCGSVLRALAASISEPRMFEALAAYMDATYGCDLRRALGERNATAA